MHIKDNARAHSAHKPLQVSFVLLLLPQRVSRNTQWLREDRSLQRVAATDLFLAATSSSREIWGRVCVHVCVRERERKRGGRREEA